MMLLELEAGEIDSDAVMVDRKRRNSNKQVAVKEAIAKRTKRHEPLKIYTAKCSFTNIQYENTFMVIEKLDMKIY